MFVRILDIIKNEIKDSDGFKILPCGRINLDYERFDEYKDSDEHPAELPFENPPLNNNKKRIQTNYNRNIPSILKYFLDASRRTYKIADIICNGRYLPVVAGQIGVGVIERDSNKATIKPLRQFCKLINVISFPDKISEDDLKYLENKSNSYIKNKFIFLRYTLKKEKDYVDLAIAKIMSEMQNMEISTMLEMTNAGLLTNDNLLIIDGPLRFKKKFDITQFRNVIGLSKSFRPSFSIGKGLKKMDVGTLTSSLSYGERTSVFNTSENNTIIGMWYMRIRDRKIINDPLQGIIKMECYAVTPEEIENGFHTDRIDTISHHIFNERIVTPFKKDRRWASHIYPIYLAEKYIKTSMSSDIVFKELF